MHMHGYLQNEVVSSYRLFLAQAAVIAPGLAPERCLTNAVPLMREPPDTQGRFLSNRSDALQSFTFCQS